MATTTCPRCRGAGQVDVRWFGLVRCGLCQGTGREARDVKRGRREGRAPEPIRNPVEPNAGPGPDLFSNTPREDAP